MSNILDTVQISGSSYDLKDKNAPSVSAVTQQEYDNLPSSAKTSNTFFVITDAEAGDLTNYYTKSETDNAITAATATKQDALVSGTNIKTINNESILGSGNIDIQGGGGKAVSGGTNISVTTGATADTINCTLPISAGTGTNALVIASDTYKLSDKAIGDYSVCLNGGGFHPNYAKGICSLAQGYDTKAYGTACHSEGYGSKAGVENDFNIQYAHAEGDHTEAKGSASHTEGFYTIANNWVEHASGRYNNSVSASTTFGDSGNTLFSVGNGTANNARHNAFEIRQNGDIYLSSGGTDIKLQDHLGGGGSSYSAGTGIDITNDVISVSGVVMSSAITTSISSSSTDSQVPSAKAVYDVIGDIETLLSQI